MTGVEFGFRQAFPFHWPDFFSDAPAQCIFDAMRHQLLLSFKNSAHMMRDTIRSDVAALGYKMLYTRAKSHTSGGRRDGLGKQGGVRRFERDVLTSDCLGVEFGD